MISLAAGEDQVSDQTLVTGASILVVETVCQNYTVGSISYTL